MAQAFVEVSGDGMQVDCHVRRVFFVFGELDWVIGLDVVEHLATILGQVPLKPFCDGQVDLEDRFDIPRVSFALPCPHTLVEKNR